MTKQSQLEGANAVRFYAAFTVILYHLIHLTKITPPASLEFIAKFGGYGVPLFYTLSAFVLCLGYANNLDTKHEWIKFYRRRFFRIAPLFYFMMVVFIVDQWVRTETFVPISLIITSATFTFNLIPGHTAGFVSASWSIGVEMLFYAIFPVIIIAVTNVRRAVLFFMLSCFISALWHNGFDGMQGASISQLRGWALPSQMQYFAAGILAYFIYINIKLNPTTHRVIIFTSILSISFIIMHQSNILNFYGKLFGYESARGLIIATWAVALAAFVIGMAFDSFSIRILTITSFLGERSFSLYLWHPFIIQTLIRCGVYQKIASHFQEGEAFIVSSILTIALVVGISMISYRYIEKNLGRALSGSTPFRRRDQRLAAAN